MQNKITEEIQLKNASFSRDYITRDFSVFPMHQKLVRVWHYSKICRGNLQLVFRYLNENLTLLNSLRHRHLHLQLLYQ